jgi:hypothetical protein
VLSHVTIVLRPRAFNRQIRRNRRCWPAIRYRTPNRSEFARIKLSYLSVNSLEDCQYRPFQVSHHQARVISFTFTAFQ